MKGAPKGNAYAKGNPGGGRPSAYAEQKEAAWLKEKWEVWTDVPALQLKLESGKYSIKDVFLAKALQGNERVLAICANKIIPDLLQVQGPGGKPLFLPSELLNKYNLNASTDAVAESDSEGHASI